jgi:mono/diheme cytochrome c family protein
VKNKFEPNAARGAAVFATTCFVCHGENGHGGKAPALNDPLRLAKLDDEWYRQTIRMGRPAKGMPTWGTVLSPNQIEDLIAMIRAWRGGTKVDTDSTVADNLRSSLFSLSQGDVEDAIFYIDRAKPMVFGAAAPEFEKIRQDLADKKLNDALAGLSKLHKEWPLGDAVQGEKIFGDACASCHGANGEGGVGRRLKPSKFTASQTNAELLQFLFVGREGTAMRGFKGRLTEKQLADAIAFLRTWQNAAEK